MMGSYVAALRAHVGSRCLFLPGVRALILNARGDVLLQRRTDMVCWGLPGGSLELEDDALGALRREVMEETGLEVLRAEPMALYSGPGERFCYPNGDEVQPFAVAFLVWAWRGVPRADGAEGSELRFWPLDALPEDLVPIHARTLEDLRHYQGRFMIGGCAAPSPEA